MMEANRYPFFPRLVRAAVVISGLALLPACSKPGGPAETAESKGGAESPAASSGAATSGSDSATTVSDVPTTFSIEHRAEAPPAGVKIPYPDADVATDITPGKRGGTFNHVTFGEGPKTFNVITSNDSTSNDVLGLMYAPLVTLDPVAQKYKGGLLKEWTMDPNDKRVWTLKLRQGPVWSDGKPITADDVIFTVDTIYDQRYSVATRDILQINGQPIKFEKVDDFTVKATLPEPSGFFQTMLGFAPVPKHAYEESVKNGTFDQVLGPGISPDKLIVSGPFKLKLNMPGERVILERNPNYYRFDKNGERLPYLDNFIISYAPDMDQMLLRFKGGDADGLERPRPADVSGLRDGQAAGNYTLHDLGADMGSNLFWFNLKEGNNPTSGKPYVDPVKLAWFKDDRFRQAVLSGINREAIIRTELRGLAVPATGPDSPANKVWYNPNVPKYPYNREKARQLLDAMGLKLNPGEQFRKDPKGNTVTFTFITNKGNTVRERVAGLIAQDLRGIGIDAKSQFLDFNALLNLTDATYEYEASLLGLTGGGIDPAGKMNSYLSSGRTNLYNPKQEKPQTEWAAEIDRLGREMIASLDPAKQRANYFKMQELYATHLPVLPLWHSKIFVATRNKFGNTKPAVLTPHLIWNADELYVKQ